MKISDLLNEDNVIAELEVNTKEEAIKSLVSTIPAEVGEDVINASLKAVLERESVMSTGVGKGLAIPHGRVKGVNENYVGFAKLAKPLDYGSIDQKPVSMVFLLIGPETQSSLHIKLLSRISKLMNNDDFREKVAQCKDSAAIVDAFRQEESQYS